MRWAGCGVVEDGPQAAREEQNWGILLPIPIDGRKPGRPTIFRASNPVVVAYSRYCT